MQVVSMKHVLFCILFVLLLFCSALFAACDDFSAATSTDQPDSTVETPAETLPDADTEDNDDVAEDDELPSGPTPDPNFPEDDESANPADVLVFTKTQDNSYAVSSTFSLSATNLIIPDNYAGLPVTEIAANAFQGNSTLQSVELPDGIIKIGANAFYECTALRSIDLPNTIESIGANAFRSCTSLTEIELPDQLQTLGENCFQNCSSLLSVTLDGTLTKIEANTFMNCISLTTVTLTDSIQEIASMAFYNCIALNDITFGNDISKIYKDAFGNSGLRYAYFPESATEGWRCGFNTFDAEFMSDPEHADLLLLSISMSLMR